jgi:hypothetical protein
VSGRKLALFACACCRALGLDRAEYREVVEAAEQRADGAFAARRVSDEQWFDLQRRLMTSLSAPRITRGLVPAQPSRDERVWSAVALAAVGLGDESRLLDVVRRVAFNAHQARPDDERRAHQVALLRDIAGNPFRPVPALPEWLFWQDRLVPRIARNLYDEGRFADLPYLADALEDAGCRDKGILGHLRSPGPHVRGCWALDLFVGVW